ASRLTIYEVSAKLLMIPFGTSATEGVYRPGASQGFTAMPDSLRYKVLLASPNGDTLAINDQRIAALHNDKVFIVVMDMRRRYCGLMTGPECHLTPVRSVKNIALYSRSRLTARCDLVYRTLHEAWEILHRFSFNSSLRRVCSFLSSLLFALSLLLRSCTPNLFFNDRIAIQRTMQQSRPNRRRRDR